MFHWVGAKPKLAEQARCFGLLGAMLRDLQPLGYTPTDPRYAEVKNAVLGIFEANAAAAIPVKTRLAACGCVGAGRRPEVAASPRCGLLGEGCGLRYRQVSGDGSRVQAFCGRWRAKAWGMGPPVTTAQLSGRRSVLVRCESLLRLGGRTVAERGRVGTCRGGSEGREYPWGNEEPDPDRANYDETKLGRVSPVGLFPRGSTPDGIADLAGNVWEWVADWYDESQEGRVIRGGAWDDYARCLRVSYRSGYHTGRPRQRSGVSLCPGSPLILFLFFPLAAKPLDFFLGHPDSARPCRKGRVKDRQAD